MNKLLLTFLFIIVTCSFVYSQEPQPASGYATIGVIETFAILFEKLELKNSSGEYVTVFEGGDFLDIYGAGPGTFGGAITTALPPIDNYTAARMQLGGQRFKGWLTTTDGDTYYTSEGSATDTGGGSLSILARRHLPEKRQPVNQITVLSLFSGKPNGRNGKYLFLNRLS